MVVHAPLKGFVHPFINQRQLLVMYLVKRVSESEFSLFIAILVLSELAQCLLNGFESVFVGNKILFLTAIIGSVDLPVTVVF